MGNWLNGKHHGYGKVRYIGGEVKEGLFENGKYVAATYEESGIESFPSTHPRAQKVDYEKYLITNDGQEKVPL